MHKKNIRDISEDLWTSPGGKFASADRGISLALGRDPASRDLNLRHPFDVELCRVPAGKALCPYHSHSAQWEYYQVMSGHGQVRDETGTHPIESGDAFIYRPGEAHQIINPTSADLLLLIVADNPIGETCFYPDSQKWLVSSPERRVIRGQPAEYLDGEE
jgi:uncharacterized cupin superfamily protein